MAHIRHLSTRKAEKSQSRGQPELTVRPRFSFKTLKIMIRYANNYYPKIDLNRFKYGVTHCKVSCGLHSLMPYDMARMGERTAVFPK